MLFKVHKKVKSSEKPQKIAKVQNSHESNSHCATDIRTPLLSFLYTSLKGCVQVVGTGVKKTA